MSATAAQVLNVLRTQSKSAAKDAVSPYDLYEYLHGEADLFGRKASITSVRIKENVDIKSGGKYRVGWVLNDQSASCMRCNAAFSLFNRRHHCRVCGYLICGECSADTVPIEALKPAEALSRRCKECRVQRRALQGDQPAADAADADAKHQPRNAEHRVEKAADALKAEEERRRAALEEQKRQRLEAFLAVPDYERSAEYAALSVAERAELTSLAAERKRQEVEGLKTQRQREVEQLTLDAADGRTAKQRAEDALAQSKRESAQRLEQDKQQRREAFLAEKATAVSGRFDEALQRQAEEERRRVEALKSDPRRGVSAAVDPVGAVDAAAITTDDAMAIAGAQEVEDEDDEEEEAGGAAALQQLGFLGSHSHLVVSEEEVARQLRVEREQEAAAEEQAAAEETLVLDDALLAQDLAAMAGAATRRASHRLSQGRLQTLDAVDATAPASTDASTGSGGAAPHFFDSPFAGQTPHVPRTMSFSQEDAAQRAAELQLAARSLALDLDSPPADAPPAAEAAEPVAEATEPVAEGAAAAVAAEEPAVDDDADDADAGRASVSSASGAPVGASSKAKGRKGSRKGKGKGRK